MGIVHRDDGEFDQACASLNMALALSRDALEKNFVSWAKAELGDTYRRMRQYTAAVQILVEAVAQAKAQSQTIEIDIFNVLLGIAQFMGGDQAGLALLEHTAQKLEIGGDQDALARCYFFRAYCYFSNKEFDKTLDYLEKTQLLAKKLGYFEFLINDGQDFPLLIHFAAAKRIDGDLFATVQKRINDKQKSSRDDLIVSTKTASIPQIEAYSMGDSKVWIFSKCIAENEWRSHRAKELFFYILCHPRQTAEQITTALWPDSTLDRTLSNFHTALYRARRATSPGIITMDGGRYQVNKNLRVYFDVFDFDKLTVAKHPGEENSLYIERLEQGINLYRGSFLDGVQGDWIEEFRRHYENRYLKTLCILAHHQKQLKHYPVAISLFERAMNIDPYQDEIYCDVIECHLAQNDRLSALRAYQQYGSTVLKELGSEPCSRLTQLMKPVTT
jgi:LuxR family transcriptional regulator, maltose regulon positive regulatory protein